MIKVQLKAAEKKTELAAGYADLSTLMISFFFMYLK
jgi:hypothetical protein